MKKSIFLLFCIGIILIADTLSRNIIYSVKEPKVEFIGIRETYADGEMFLIKVDDKVFMKKKEEKLFVVEKKFEILFGTKEFKYTRFVITPNWVKKQFVLEFIEKGVSPEYLRNAPQI